jgi:L-asparaginase
MKVLVLFCGGTLIMKKNSEGALVVPERSEAVSELLNLEPKISEIADIEVEFIDNIDSTNMHPGHWDKMTNVIAERYYDYDGFIITHGTDTMAYTASALSFTLGNLGKPVIITGAQIPGYKLETDAKRNFINATKLATKDISGVYIVFDERIIHGVRATKVSESELNAFRSVSSRDHGQIRVDLRFTEKINKRHNGELKTYPGFNPQISVVTLTPGNDPSDLMHLLDSDRVKGIIIEGYGSGNIPYNHYPVFEKARDSRIPVLIMSQCLHGVTTMKYYDVGLQALKLGVIECFDLTLEAASTKLMWALDKYAYEEIKKIIHTNFVGEINISQD